MSCLLSVIPFLFLGVEPKPAQAEPQIYLCTLEYSVPWMRRSMQPRDYQARHTLTWIEAYYPSRGVAVRLTGSACVTADDKRYAGGTAPALPFASREDTDLLWHDYHPTRVERILQLRVDDKIRAEHDRAIEAHAKKTTKPLTQMQARAHGVAFANDALKAKKYRDASGKEQAFPTLVPESWNYCEKQFGRWRLGLTPSAGITVVISFKSDGSDPKLESASFASD